MPCTKLSFEGEHKVECRVSVCMPPFCLNLVMNAHPMVVCSTGHEMGGVVMHRKGNVISERQVR
jgi:hypothetical protein